MVETCTLAGLAFVRTMHPYYGSEQNPRPMHLHLFTAGPYLPLPKEYIEAVNRTHGLQTVKAAIAPFVRQGGILLDVCVVGRSIPLRQRLIRVWPSTEWVTTTRRWTRYEII